MHHFSKSQPLVSVIIPFLNEERFLRDAVESVLKQDYPHWELRLIDDGSQDQSTQIAQEYAARFPGQIFYHAHEHHANKGLSASRNYAIRQARGKYIALLDADDVWLPGKLSYQVGIVQQHPEVAMIAEGSVYWYNWADASKSNVTIPVGAPPDRAYPGCQLFQYLYPLGRGAAPCPSGLFIDKAAFDRVGGFEESFRKEYGLYEDQAFLNKIYLTETVYVSSACHNLYRQRSGSIVDSVHADGKYHTVRQYFLTWFGAYLRKTGHKDKAVQGLLAKALYPYKHPLLHLITDKLPGTVLRLVKQRV
ncbi:glycosyltransferase family 2 protein [Rufibacter psychrotolerans]|uniref:glycosyltransferase family 2 protein n=1 Tax=Rufibacter psychrotolerans TaxID=2812556 RepID=UPI001966D3BC|nr:glycosyltransferase family 2 protein [Rufibacter sp. SYSU D00308]